MTPPSFVPGARGDSSERRALSQRERDLEHRRMFANELASDIVERERQKRTDTGDWSERDRAAEAARVQELSQRIYDRLTRAEQEASHGKVSESHRGSLAAGASEAAELFSKEIADRFRALRGGRSRAREA